MTKYKLSALHRLIVEHGINVQTHPKGLVATIVQEDLAHELVICDVDHRQKVCMDGHMLGTYSEDVNFRDIMIGLIAAHADLRREMIQDLLGEDTVAKDQLADRRLHLLNSGGKRPTEEK